MRGIRGWLGLYSIILGLSLIGEGYYFLLTIISEYTILTKVLGSLLIAFSIFLIIYSLILISEEKKKAIIINRIVLWFNLIIGIMFISTSTINLGRDGFVSSVSQLLIPTIITVIWLIYWYRSERVESTMIN